jgi:hypothetical protein
VNELDMQYLTSSLPTTLYERETEEIVEDKQRNNDVDGHTIFGHIGEVGEYISPMIINFRLRATLIIVQTYIDNERSIVPQR